VVDLPVKEVMNSCSLDGRNIDGGLKELTTANAEKETVYQPKDSGVRAVDPNRG
jgi:hypothetical protein